MSRLPPLCDEVTAEVLGVKALLDRAQPDSEAAERAWRAPQPWRAAQRSEWLTTQAAQLEAERAWLALSELKREALRRQLAELPAQAPRQLKRLALGEPLGEAELFCLKRLMYRALRCGQLIPEALSIERDVPETLERLGALLHALHPEQEPSARFHLSEALDPDLAAALKRDARARRAFTQRRKALLDLKRADYPGARFDLEGEARLTGALATRAATDPQLEPAGGGGGALWRLRDQELEATRLALKASQREVARHASRLCAELSSALAPHVTWLLQLHAHLVNLDLRLARARLREAIQGCWPVALPERSARLEMRRARAHDLAQPIDFELDDEPAVIVGPNMGGKSSLLKLVGLCQWCMQHGLPAPAELFCAPPCEHLVYVGSDEALGPPAGALSSFGREIQRLVTARQRCGSPTLWLLDEIGRGTHPEEGAALAAQIITALKRRGDRALCATHFPELAALRSVARWRIAGLVERDKLEALAAQASRGEAAIEPSALELALRQAMDYRAVRIQGQDAEVPRDAHLIARLLGW